VISCAGRHLLLRRNTLLIPFRHIACCLLPYSPLTSELACAIPS
jgi:hypothetical protein